MNARHSTYLAAGAVALSLGALAAATPAEAQYRARGGYQGAYFGGYNQGAFHRGAYHRGGYYRGGTYRRNAGGALAAGLIGGLALGAIGSAIAAPSYGYAPAYGYGYGYAPAGYGYGYGYNSVYDYGSNPVYYSGFAGGPAYGYGYAPRRTVYFSNGYGYGGCRIVRQRVRLDAYTVGVRRVRVCG